jgi:hypothetical protein
MIALLEVKYDAYYDNDNNYNDNNNLQIKFFSSLQDLKESPLAF